MPQEPEIIEAQVVEISPAHTKRTTLNGEKPMRTTVIRANQPPTWHTPGDHARPYGDRGGLLGGFLTLLVGFLVTVLILLVSVCIVFPFALLMRLLNVRKSK